MNNEQIIYNDVIEMGILSEQEAIDQIEEYGELQFHTLQGWKQRNRLVKKGEHALWETRLWKKKKKKDNEQDEKSLDSAQMPSSRDFYLAKSFIFSFEQTEKMESKKA